MLTESSVSATVTPDGTGMGTRPIRDISGFLLYWRPVHLDDGSAHQT
jgi:hypothetical protein